MTANTDGLDIYTRFKQIPICYLAWYSITYMYSSQHSKVMTNTD